MCFTFIETKVYAHKTYNIITVHHIVFLLFTVRKQELIGDTQIATRLSVLLNIICQIKISTEIETLLFFSAQSCLVFMLEDIKTLNVGLAIQYPLKTY